jgi:hypothetical protein
MDGDGHERKNGVFDRVVWQTDIVLGECPQARGRAGGDRLYLVTLFKALDQEYSHPAPTRDLLQRSLVSTLEVWLSHLEPQCQAAS